MQPKQKIPPAGFATAFSPQKPKHWCPSQGRDRARAALLHQGPQAAQGHSAVAADMEPAAGQKASSSTQPLTSTLLKRAELALGTGRTGICPEEWSFDSCEAACSSIGEARLAEEVGVASLAGAFPIPHLPPDIHHSSLEMPNPTLSSTKEEPDGKSVDQSLVVLMEIEIQFQHLPACPAAGFPA